MSIGGVGPLLRSQPFADRGTSRSGLLKLKWCGDSSSKLRPQVVARPMLAKSVDRPLRPPSASSPTRATCTTPLPRSRAASTESASRDRVDPADDRAIYHDFDPVFPAVAEGRAGCRARCEVAIDPDPVEA